MVTINIISKVFAKLPGTFQDSIINSILNSRYLAFRISLIKNNITPQGNKAAKLRKTILEYIKHDKELNGILYQPIDDKIVADIPHREGHCEEVFLALKNSIPMSQGRLLDIGANIGYFCAKFEDIGFECVAVENDKQSFYILNELKKYQNKKFKAVSKSIFDAKEAEEPYNVVLALNVFHHFLKKKSTYVQLQQLLGKLKTDYLFFEPHRFDEPQMANAFKNYNEEDFVKFIQKYANLQERELIYAEKSGRHVYKLSKNRST